jgi:choline dehydrogenase-like flavoprotein
MPTKPEFDVGIIGGGPAGSAAAGYLAKAGVRCVVFERELFPRPHVGESFVPATTRVLRDLNFIDQMEEAKFPRKYGAAWTSSAQATYSHDFQNLPSDYNVDVRFEERQQPRRLRRRPVSRHHRNHRREGVPHVRPRCARRERPSDGPRLPAPAEADGRRIQSVRHPYLVRGF